MTTPGTKTLGAACMNLLREISVFAKSYAESFGVLPDQVVVLAGTSMCAALSGIRDPEHRLWSYDREKGALTVSGSRVLSVICEHPSMDEWQVEITAPGDFSLGHPRVHRATIGLEAA